MVQGKKVTVVTPTCNRPEAFALCERWVARQTRQPDEWIVADGGTVPTACMMGQHHIHDPRPPGFGNFIGNLRNAVKAATGDMLIVVEDDDFYRSDHIEQTVRRLESSDICGGIWQPYYFLPHRVWRMFRNRGSSLCQTGMRAALVPMFLAVLDDCERRKSFGVDGKLWDTARAAGLRLDEYDDKPVIGVKGLPGQAGLGVGHRPSGPWKPDPEMRKLREWIGEDVEVYAGLQLLTRTPT